MLMTCRTFSDNGTATQPLYGEIAADPAKRQSFANNVVRFMTQYGESPCFSFASKVPSREQRTLKHHH